MNAAHAKKIMTQKVILESIYDSLLQDQFYSMYFSFTGKLHRYNGDH